MQFAPTVADWPRLAHHLQRPLWRCADEAKRAGYTLPAEVLRFLADVDELAELHRMRVTDASDANVSRSADVQTVEQMMSAVEVGELLGINRHGVADLARRGRLPGHKVGRRWQFDPTDVDEWRSNRGAA